MASVPRLSSRLVPPPDEATPYNLTVFVGSRLAQLKEGVVGASQFAQDLWVDQALRGMRGGLVVESGAFDGEKLSNSLLLEVARGWNCLLVEANPTLQEQIIARRRRCHVLRGGLSTTAHESAFDFQLASATGGIVSTLHEKQAGQVVSVPCYPLHRVLWHTANRSPGGGGGGSNDYSAAAGHMARAPRARITVDFWSLDTEGSEVAILNATDFGTLEVGVLLVEHAGRHQSRAAVHSLLRERGFVRVSCHDTDDYFAHPDYFAARGIAMPTAAIKAPVLASELASNWQLKRGGMTGHGFRHQRCPADALARR